MGEKRVSIFGRSTLLETRIIEILRTRLRLAQLSQRELEGRLGWSRGRLNSLLRGRAPIRLDVVERLCEAAGFSLHEVLLEALGVPHRRLKVGPGEWPANPKFQPLNEAILEVERLTEHDLTRIRAAVRRLEDTSLDDIAAFMRLFMDLMSRYSELTAILNDFIKRRR